MKTCLLCDATSAGTAVTFKRRRDICDWCEDELSRTGSAWCATGQHKVSAADMATGKPRCRACERERNRGYDRTEYVTAWRAANADRIVAASAAYREAHREEARAYKRQYYRRNLAVARQKSRERYQRYRHQKLAARKRLYWQNPDAWRHDAKMRAVRKKLAILRGER